MNQEESRIISVIKLNRCWDLFYEINSTIPYTEIAIDYYNMSQKKSEFNYKDCKLYGLVIEWRWAGYTLRVEKYRNGIKLGFIVWIKTLF